MVLGTFFNKDDVERAIFDLNTLGYNPKNISVEIKDLNPYLGYHSDSGSGIFPGLFLGAGIGGMLGGIVGLLIGLGTIVFPGINSLFIGRSLVEILGLSGTVATIFSGVVTGLLAGGLIGLGISRKSEEKILVSVPTAIRQQNEVREVFQAYGASQIKTVKDFLASKMTTSQPEYSSLTQSIRSSSPAFYSEVRRTTLKKRT